MAKTSVAGPAQLSLKDRVVAAKDLPGIPAGTPGKVSFVQGFTWIRYWIRWDNGVLRGSMNRNVLATPGEWKRLEERRALGLADDDTAAGAVAAADDGAGEALAAGAVVNGVSIPAMLLERSKARRALLTGG
ncbi:MAG: hypothetical protein ACR2LQ_04530 [Acidimicrobiales bacterium]